MSHETIYRALSVQGPGLLRLEVAAALLSERATRRPQRFRNMVIISDRPQEIENRAVSGRWVGALTIGLTSSQSAIGTLVERTSGCRCMCLGITPLAP